MSDAQDAGEVHPSTCLACRRVVWCWAGGSVAGGGPLLFDLVGRGGGRMLLVHGCCLEERPGEDEWDDPDDDRFGPI